jgi:hypothetical protein
MVVRVTKGKSGGDGRYGHECKGWAAYVSMSELARLGIGWEQIDAAIASDDRAMRAMGNGMLLGNPESVRAYVTRYNVFGGIKE